MRDNIYQKILDENIRLHRIEAKFYEGLHPEEFNWFEQMRIWKDLKFILRQLRGRIALDLGCGTGNIFLKLLELGFKVWGVDISEEMLEVLKKRIPLQFKDKAMLSSQNIDDFLTTSARRFDLITMSSVLHHLPRYLETLEMAMAILNSGGLLYITHESTSSALAQDPFLRKILWQLDNIMYLALNSGRSPSTEKRDYRMSDYNLYHGFSEKEIFLRCEKPDLRVIKFEKYSSAMRLGISSWLDTNVLKSRRQFCLIVKKL